MRISDWSSDVCSSDLSCDERPAAETEKGEKEARCGKGDRQAKHDLDEATETARRLAERQCETSDDNDDDRDDLGDGALHGLQHLLQRLLPRHAGAGGLDLRSEEHTSELQSLMRISYAVFCL